ncbi:hypothetical protein UFOVP135_66 [uncultured Caudovirales phage]|uniref:Uncharacterized protein n=1 Tax=uncultured Caudovirales phage TaxID=2100421 RepID=A0A6J5LFN6_9CAUD|nr:hypothetical protein UFOVP135_66 [uncultured Caudovirales phage]
MIELSLLEIVLMLSNIVVLYFYLKSLDEIKTNQRAITAVLYGIHTGKLKITDTGNCFKVEPV